MGTGYAGEIKKGFSALNLFCYQNNVLSMHFQLMLEMTATPPYFLAYLALEKLL